jgi:Phage protein (N4 Gp49/phage Sf6 gene 66) family
VNRDDELEQTLQAKGLTAGPRLTPEAIEALVASEAYYSFPGTTVTVCALTTHTGFVAIGHSACINKANFDTSIGSRIAREKALNSLWECEAYCLIRDMARTPPQTTTAAEGV